jgi:hypothetical protein
MVPELKTLGSAQLHLRTETFLGVKISASYPQILKVHVLIKILEALKEINQVDSFHCY